MLSFATSPYIITTWIGGPISQSVLEGPGWRWGFGIFTIVVPIVVAPLCLLFFWNQQKAKKMGLFAPTRGPLTLSTVKQYCIEVDLIGIILLAGGMALFLLPFSLWSMALGNDHLHDHFWRAFAHRIRSLRAILGPSDLRPIQSIDGPNRLLRRVDVHLRVLQLNGLGELLLINAPGSLGAGCHRSQLYLSHL